MFVRIDAHHHVWDLAVRDQPWTATLPQLRRSFGMDELRPSLAEHSIDATILVQTVAVPEETPELLQLAYVDPNVAGVVGWIELSAPDVTDRLAELNALPGNLVGVRHGVQNEPDPRWLCRSQVRRGIAAVGAAGLSYDLLITPSQLGAAIETVRASGGVWGVSPESMFTTGIPAFLAACAVATREWASVAANAIPLTLLGASEP
jgi:L-fuconolactonase